MATASTVRAWLLLEQPGPWGADLPRETRLPARVKVLLRRVAAELGIRAVLLRRHGRSAPERRHVWFARTDPDRVWMEHAVVDGPEALLDVDLPALARGEPTGTGEPDPGPLFLVCTNGRRDPCCAEQGRPLARSLAESFEDRAWECSHIGGDRFAGNLVCFPHGLYFGRLGPGDGPAVARTYAEGRVDLEHYRGRCGYGFAVQAAEHFLREQRGLTGVDDLALEGWESLPGGDVVGRFRDRTTGRQFTVRVASAWAEARKLTCHAERPGRSRTFDLVDLAEA